MPRSFDMAVLAARVVAPSEPPSAAASRGTVTGTSTSESNDAQRVGDILEAGPHDGVAVSYDPVDRAVSIDNTDKGSVAVAAHEALPDPHSQYVLEAEFPELVDDRVDALLVADRSVEKTYDDGGNTLTLRLTNDQVAPGAMMSYATDSSGAKGWHRPSLFESTGVLSGGALSINAGDNTKFDMAAGVYGFADYSTNAAQPVRSVLVKSAVTAQTVTSMAAVATYVGVDSSGTIIQQASPFTNTQRRTISQVGVLVHSNHTNLNAVNDTAAPVSAGISQLHDLITALGAFNVSGNSLSANGANLSINKSAGTLFKLGSTFQATPLSPHLVSLASLTAPSTMRYRTSTGTETANTAVIDPTQYESSPGVLSTLSNPNKFSVQRVSLFTSNLIRIQWGQTEYDTLLEAEAAIPTQPFTTEANIAENGVLIGFLILRRSTTSLNNPSDAKFIAVGKFGVSATGGGTVVNTDGLPEGAVNLYFTDARARAATVASSIVNGDTTHAPSGDAVFDALATKADLAGATFSGALSASYATPEIAVATNGTGQIGAFSLYNNGLASAQRRWRFAKSTTAETGSNAGSNLVIQSFDDAGTVLHNVLTMTRSSGIVTAAIGFSSPLYTATATGGFTMTAAAGSARRMVFQTSAVDRWQFGATGDAETGSNAGSNFAILRYSDAGSLVDIPLSISRANGQVTLVNDLNVSASVLANNLTSTSGAITSATNFNSASTTDCRWQINGTSDGSDTGRLLILPAGTASASRGAFITVSGNEAGTNPGTILLAAGTGFGITMAAQSGGVTVTGAGGMNISTGPLTVAGVTTLTDQASTIGGFTIGLRGRPRATSTTITATSADRCHSVTGGITIPTTGMVEGVEVLIYNRTDSAITLTQASGLTLRLGGTTTTGNRTLAARGIATIWYESATEAICTGNVT